MPGRKHFFLRYVRYVVNTGKYGKAYQCTSYDMISCDRVPLLLLLTARGVRYH
jgi:hypothetical protein